MSWNITGSVGRWERGAVNRTADVRVIQQLLALAFQRSGDPRLDPGRIDGGIARPPRPSPTVNAIEHIQAQFMSRPDGLVEPGGRTWQRLVEGAERTPSEPDDPTDGPFCFPFAAVPDASWIEAPRSFGSRRASGRRAHAGCDLYAPKGTWIYAVADGRVVRGPYYFYAGTYALDVDHGAFLIRYGEIQSNALVRAGDTVEAGQRIAQVGHLLNIRVPSDMLHLEMYGKTATGPLTVPLSVSKRTPRGTPFLRRMDLMDPTVRLTGWVANLPG